MDKTLMKYLINIIILVPFVLLLIRVSLRLGKRGVDNFNMMTYAQVIERVSLNKETTLYVLKLGNEGRVIITSAHKTEVIKELNENEIEEIVRMKKEKQRSIDLPKISCKDVKNILSGKYIREK